MKNNVVAFPRSAPYETIMEALTSEELHAVIEALSLVSTASAENMRLRNAIVRELSIREAYLRRCIRQHPAGHS